ncbi:MAG: hypothetical protein IIY46_00725 [Lachnospiraceae bacterium]|nr:hypothetical protein [Lachnospiraceae bacterium]
MERSFSIEIKGYSKEEVDAYIDGMEEDQKKKIARIEEASREKDRVIAELRRRVALKEQQRETLEYQIETKYKKYIENYDKIASLVYDAEVRADETMKAAHEKEQKILAEADAEAKRRVDAVEEQVRAAMEDGQAQYRKIWSEIRALADILDRAEGKFTGSKVEVSEILRELPPRIDFAADGTEDMPEELDTAVMDIPEVEEDFDEDETEPDLTEINLPRTYTAGT